MPESEYPKTLVHPDIKGAEITAASRTSERSHKASGWVEKTDDTSTSAKSTSSTSKKTS